MPDVAVTTAAAPGVTQRPWSVAWVGGAAGVELAWARAAAAQFIRVHDHDLDTPCSPDRVDSPSRPMRAGPLSVAAFHGRRARLPFQGAVTAGRPVARQRPTVVVLATESPGRWQLDACILLARRWPLAVLVAVTTTLGDGRRRSGPALPGVEEVMWNEFPARLRAWLADLDAGVPGPLGVPPTARREERVLQVAEAVVRGRTNRATPVLVAAPDTLSLEGLTDAVLALGHTISARCTGRPPVADSSDIVVWEVAEIDPATLAWLRLLTSERPRRQVVIIDAFPRGETALAALRAGGAAILGRPLGLEPLMGALLQAHDTIDRGSGRAADSGPASGLGSLKQSR